MTIEFKVGKLYRYGTGNPKHSGHLIITDVDRAEGTLTVSGGMSGYFRRLTRWQLLRWRLRIAIVWPLQDVRWAVTNWLRKVCGGPVCVGCGDARFTDRDAAVEGWACFGALNGRDPFWACCDCLESDTKRIERP